MPVRRQRSLQALPHAFLLALGVAAALPAAGAEIVLYERDSFRGRSFVSGQTISNFANVDFNDRAASVIIRSGSWQLCADAYFRGRCVTLGPGEYPTLRSMALTETALAPARGFSGRGAGARTWWRTKWPERGRASTSPSFSSWTRAWSTVATETCSSAASCRTEGKRSPGLRVPASIAAA